MRLAHRKPSIDATSCVTGLFQATELLVEQLSENFHVIAPDTLGNGDTMAPSQEQPEIADYAAAMKAFADGLAGNASTSMERILARGSQHGWH